MRVRMKKTMAGPEFTASEGAVIEVPNAMAKELFEADAAEEVREVDVEFTSRFHGGLTAVQPAKVDVAVPPNPDMSQFREDQEVDVVMDRRTADEFAADARREAVGPVLATGPRSVKSSNELEAEEIEAKIATSQASEFDDKDSEHAKTVERGARAGAKSTKADTKSTKADDKDK